MHQSVKLTPLTAEEQAFAEENHRILVGFLNSNRLDHGEFYGVAAMGYLQAVKKWFARPELQQNAFSTIAWRAMSCRISNERRKQGSRIRTVSLEETIPGTDGRTYMDMITDRHQQFLKGEPDMGLKINYDVPVPEGAKARGGNKISVEAETILNFRRSKKHEDYMVYRLADKIYIEKVKAGRK